MIKPILVVAALGALAGCSGGMTPDPVACANAQKAVAVAEAAIIAYPDQEHIPPLLQSALLIAKAELPVFCPMPVTVVVEAG
jgi:hypothetical protein